MIQPLWKIFQHFLKRLYEEIYMSHHMTQSSDYMSHHMTQQFYSSGEMRASTLALVTQSQSCVTLCDPIDLRPSRLLCPWNSPSKSTGVGSHFLLQGLFLTQGSNPGTPHCRQVLYFLSHQGSPNKSICPHKNAYGSIVRKSQKMETAHLMVIL